MARTSLQVHQYQRLSHIRQWQIHAGANHFCCDGHCITGRSLSGAIAVIGLISFTSLLWFIFELPVLLRIFPGTASVLLVLIAVLLLFYTYSESAGSRRIQP